MQETKKIITFTWKKREVEKICGHAFVKKKGKRATEQSRTERAVRCKIHTNGR